MANLTYDALISADVWGVLRHPEDMQPVGTTLHVFNVHQGVLIWYFRDKRWYMGKVVHLRDALYEVEFNVGGPRIRDWYHPLDGDIMPNNPHFRDLLRARGNVIMTRDHNPRSE